MAQLDTAAERNPQNEVVAGLVSKAEAADSNPLNARIGSADAHEDFEAAEPAMRNQLEIGLDLRQGRVIENSSMPEPG